MPPVPLLARPLQLLLLIWRQCPRHPTGEPPAAASVMTVVKTMLCLLAAATPGASEALSGPTEALSEPTGEQPATASVTTVVWASAALSGPTAALSGPKAAPGALGSSAELVEPSVGAWSERGGAVVSMRTLPAAAPSRRWAVQVELAAASAASEATVPPLLAAVMACRQQEEVVKVGGAAQCRALCAARYQ